MAEVQCGLSIGFGLLSESKVLQGFFGFRVDFQAKLDLDFRGHGNAVQGRCTRFRLDRDALHVESVCSELGVAIGDLFGSDVDWATGAKPRSFKSCECGSQT